MSGSTAALRAPVIVTGAPRTGVRLLAALLDGHPNLASGPDLPALVTVVQQWQELGQSLGANHAAHYGLSRDEVRDSFRSTISSLYAPRLAAAGKARFVIQSFAAVVCVGAFGRLFPDARVIVTLRDPRDTVASVLASTWHDPRDGRRLPATLDPGLAARLWADSTALALDTGRELEAAGRLIALRYEELCRSPAATLAAIGRFIGEAPPPALVRDDAARLVTMTTDNPHPPLRAGDLSDAGIGRWQRELGPGQLAAVDGVAGILARQLGYQ